MTAAARKTRSAVPQVWHTQLQPRWQALAARERLALLAAGVAVGLALLWWIGIAPARRTLQEAPAQRATLETQLAQMQRQAADVRRLRNLPPIPLAQAQAALNAATDRLGGKAKVALIGDRATVTFTGIEGPALLAWLAEVRTGGRARPIDAQLKRLGRAYDGTVTLAFAATQEPR